MEIDEAINSMPAVFIAAGDHDWASLQPEVNDMVAAVKDLLERHDKVKVFVAVLVSLKYKEISQERLATLLATMLVRAGENTNVHERDL